MPTGTIKAVKDLLRKAGKSASVRSPEAMESLLAFMESEGFFTSPASVKHHNACEGGLADHSLRVYHALTECNQRLDLGIPEESVAIAALLHDICKMGKYLGSKPPYVVNESCPPGHGNRSIWIIRRFIGLTELEANMIRYHMGVYGLNEFDAKSGEYPLRGGGLANAWFHHPAVKVMYFCDELATLKEKAQAMPVAVGANNIVHKTENGGESWIPVKLW